MVAGQLSAGEIERRLPLWIALSDLFLDTEPTRSTYENIARTIIGHGFQPEHAEAIFREDVAPAFWINLLAPAGEWQGWEDGLVRERVIRSRRSPISRFAAWLFCRRIVDEEWAKVAALL